MIITIGKQDYQVRMAVLPTEITERLKEVSPDFFTYDTESTGLHIKKDKPFWGAICFNNEVFVFPTNREFLVHLPVWAKLVKTVYCHNTTFDMHMTANIIDEAPVLSIDNWGDTMGLCRLSFQAISTRDGGDSLALKKVGTKYIDKSANRFELAVKDWLKKRESEQNKVLTALLRPLKWSYTKVNNAIKAEEDLPDDVKCIYLQWQKDMPRPTYKDVPEEIMLPYLAVDVILTKRVVDMATPVIMRRQQHNILHTEFKLLRTIFKMERVGFKLDRKYLQESLARIDTEIEKVRSRAYELAGRQFKSGQHQVIKQMYESIKEEQLESVDKKVLKGFMKDGDELAGLIMRWRTLDKWRGTYIIKLLRDSEYDGRLYTTLGQFNPVSGRFSGDAQQFPKKAIYTEEGEKILKSGHKPGIEHEIYHPRRAIQVSGSGYNSMYYLDFSQVELRVQAHYTLPFGGDLNLCRAYMPFKCTHFLTGEEYKFDTLDERKKWIELRRGHPTDLHWEEQLKQGWSVWVVPETGEPWKPTDVHAQTTTKALGILGYDLESMSPDDFAQWRGIGKGFNFMRNYGGGAKKAADTLGITMEEAEAMVNGYTEAFPKVVDYQNFVIKCMWDRGFVRNLSGRRYYLKDSWRFYKCANYLIQGSCADDLKQKMILIDEFLTRTECKSHMVMCIHDEIQFEVWEGEDWIIPKIKSIMEYTPDVKVPIVSDVERTTGTWADKKKVVLAA